jgi:D-aspartate ligase
MAKLPTLDTTYPALIFNAGRDTIHHGAVGIARSLGRLGVPVYAVVEDAHTPLAHSRYLTKAFVWEKWPANWDALLSGMSSIADTIGRPAILFPLDDWSAVFVAENANILRQRFLFPKLPPDLPRQLANKANLHSLCAKLGIPFARSLCPHSAAEVREFSKHVGFPIVVKATEQWRHLNGKRSARFITTRESLSDLCKHIESEQPSRMILQEYVPGDDWIYHGYSDPDLNLYVSFTGRKLLNYPPAGGSTALGVSLNNDTVRRQAEMLLKLTSYSGISDMDWRRDERDGQYKLMDCNPRVGMNFRMFEDYGGIDVVRAQHLNLSGKIVSATPMIEGRLTTVESYWLLSSLRGGRRKAFKTEDNHALRTRSRELAWSSSDDPLPLLVMTIRLPLQEIKRALRMIWEKVAGSFTYSRKGRLLGGLGK